MGVLKTFVERFKGIRVGNILTDLETLAGNGEKVALVAYAEYEGKVTRYSCGVGVPRRSYDSGSGEWFLALDGRGEKFIRKSGKKSTTVGPAFSYNDYVLVYGGKTAARKVYDVFREKVDIIKHLDGLQRATTMKKS